MKVEGFSSSTCLPPTWAAAVSPLNLSRSTATPAFSAIRSNARNPALWRVFSYLLPGLPSPATRYSTGPEGAGFLEKNSMAFLASCKKSGHAQTPQPPQGVG